MLQVQQRAKEWKGTQVNHSCCLFRNQGQHCEQVSGHNPAIPADAVQTRSVKDAGKEPRDIQLSDEFANPVWNITLTVTNESCNDPYVILCWEVGHVPAVMTEKPHKGLYCMAGSYSASGLLVVAGHVEEESCCSILAIGLGILQQLHSVRYDVVSQHDRLRTPTPPQALPHTWETPLHPAPFARCDDLCDSNGTAL